ncbi:histidine kinase [Algoriphagus halophytocola]|uniref:Histidine kinase n=1 Tax=Algoriphagus halophytocola TaxID=2991499 RepID=A0ABY6MF32_9BACT|nr:MULTISPECIES: histidine kinase [unclassified Algoriphagus]UZD22397.1 histidine kinase [Algoriphagus sp. TR-M5]WBL43656.1 histidine kinase [Algoriphagus sp. TR-M9]
MINLSPKRRVSILVHILGWSMLCTVLLLLSPLSWRVDIPMEFWIRQLFMAILLVVIFYINMLWFVPNVLLKGKHAVFILTVSLGCVLFVGVLIYTDFFLHLPELMHKAFNPDEPYVPKPRRISGDIFNIMLYLMTIGISTSVASVQKWQKDEALRRELDQQRINTELSYLKAQINPHFFFNTLNNIYALTNLDVKKAQEALLKLSRMMRYVLYENQKNETLLSREVSFVNDYIELMKMRLTDKVTLNISIDDPKDDLAVAPMLLLPFLENCFKHGVSSQEPSEIFIKLEIMGSTVFFETRNHIFPVNKDSPEAKENGIGLVNTQRRLSLLYPNKHRLKFGKDESKQEYWVNLTINLE